MGHLRCDEEEEEVGGQAGGWGWGGLFVVVMDVSVEDPDVVL